VEEQGWWENDVALQSSPSDRTRLLPKSTYEPGSKFPGQLIARSVNTAFLGEAYADDERRIMELTQKASQNWIFQPLLNLHSRTLAACCDPLQIPRCVSDRIGAHYSPSAARLAVNPKSIEGHLTVYPVSAKHEIRANTQAQIGAHLATMTSTAQKTVNSQNGLPTLVTIAAVAEKEGSNIPSAMVWGGHFDADSAIQDGTSDARSNRRQTRGKHVRGGLKGIRPVGGMAAADSHVHSLWEQSAEANVAVVNGNTSATGRTVGPETTGVDSRDEQAQALTRYMHYLKGAIPHSGSAIICPMKEEWVVNILELVPSLPEEPDQAVEYLLRMVLQEIKEDYYFSVKKSMLDYMLRSDEQRDRLLIAAIPTDCAPEGWGWGEGKVVPDAPLFWRQSVETAHTSISENLVIIDPLMVRVLDLWQDYADRLLVDLPQTDEEAQAMSWRAQTVEEFAHTQREHRDKVLGELHTHWQPALTKIFTDAFEDGEFDIPDHQQPNYFNALAVLVSGHLRSLVMRSIEALVKFFDRFEEEHVPANNGVRSQGKLQAFRKRPYSSEETSMWRPAFTARLRVDARNPNEPCIGWETSPAEMRRVVMDLFERVIDCLGDAELMSRVEARVLLPLAQTPEMAPGMMRRELFPVRNDEQVVMEARSHLLQVLETNFQSAKERFAVYAPFTFLLNEAAQLQQFVADAEGSSEGTLSAFGKRIHQYATTKERLQKDAPHSMSVTLIYVQCDGLNAELDAKAQDLVRELLEHISEDTIARNKKVVSSVKGVDGKLRKRPNDSKEMVRDEEFLAEVKADVVPEMDTAVREIRERLDFLFENRHDMSEDLLDKTGTTFARHRLLGDMIDDAKQMLSKERTMLEDRFFVKRKKFEEELAVMAEHAATFKTKSQMRDLYNYVAELEGLEKNIEETRQNIGVINDEEVTLGMTATEFNQANEVEKVLEPYKNLWTTIARFDKAHKLWTKGPLFELDAEQVEEEAKEIFITVNKASLKLAQEAPEVAEAAMGVKERVDEFQQSLPLIRALCQKGLKERHWTSIADVIGFPIKPEDRTNTLSRLVDLGIETHLEGLEAISEMAGKEFGIETKVNQMQQEWMPLAFEFFEKGGTYIVGGGSLEEIQVLLDDHVVKSQTFASSPYAQALGDELNDWVKILVNLQNTIEIWLKVQATWLYLEPIFGSEDIMRQMPVEGKKFKKVDSMWRQTMSTAKDSEKCLEFAKLAGVEDKLKHMDQELEVIQKGLNSYLETKQIYFPRFFFHSNDELLEILAETKDPLRVQPHLKKCFDGLNTLEFRPNPQVGSPDILAMYDSKKERVQFTEVLNPASAHGAVEVWLLEVERLMRDSLKDACQKAIADYPTKKRIDWCLCWAGQLVLNVGQLYWTKEFETAVAEKGPQGVKDYVPVLVDQLADIINAVRGELTKIQRGTLSALCVIDVHARDVMLMLVELQLAETNNFDWQSQLRYYWEDNTLMAKMINSVLEYGYEYIGNCGRLVITPLSDRCYRTLMGAIHLQYGGAPEGPAGTGKTETVKDLAKALSRQCVVTNCSDQLDYLAMAKFFKGLASSGAWACFDEFNRITLEVLSVVAQQVSEIQQAIAKKLTHFVFEGTELSLRWTANSFITMNPGYAGRAELPDNLKVLFRTVAMMVPDYAMIAEIMLMAFGYENAKPLSIKIVATYKLCSEQLSSQDHYDYGMRAVMAVLRAAGNLKQKFGFSMSEDILMLRAIQDVNLAKFLSHDIKLFGGITSDLFPGTVLPEADYTDMKEAIHRNIKTLKLQPTDSFLEKIIQLYEMIVVRHGLMVVGLPFSGKTANIRVLAGTLTDLCEGGKMPCALNPDHELATDLLVVNPKAITQGQLYGQFDDVSHEWSDGVLAIQYRIAATAADERRKWIVFDGPVDAIWIENMNTVLDDNKKLCLNSGESIQMSGQMSMIFETMDLAVASPATVSRCGMVYMEPEKLGWRPLVASWMETLPPALKDNEKNRAALEQLFDWLVDPVLFFVRRSLHEMVPTGASFMVTSLCAMFTSVTDEFAGEEGVKKVESMKPQEVISWIDSLFVFSLVWSAGSTLDAASREQFDEFVRSLLSGDDESAPPPRKVDSKAVPPTSGLLYDYVFLKEGKGKWIAWKDMLDKAWTIPPTADFSQIIVPTMDTARYTYLLQHLLEHGKQPMLCGPTGTGKTVDLNQYLLSLPVDKNMIIQTQFSAQTSANMTQDLIDGKLEKRRKGIFGPGLGKRAIIFVDDLNMPEIEEYGAQPPIEILRQWMDHGGWYDLGDKSFRTLIDMQYCTAMGPPGGGRNHITPRMIRHFQVVGMVEAQPAVLSAIYSKILDWYMGKENLGDDLGKLTKPIVGATLAVYQIAQEKLLPTPAKSHYMFNLRDFSRVVQGVTMVKKGQLEGDKPRMVRLWVHEIHRVFGDRLVDVADKEWFLGMLKEAVPKNFSVKLEDICAHLVPADAPKGTLTLSNMRNLIWGDFKVAGADPKLYDEFHDEVAEGGAGIRKILEDYLEEYNTMAAPMKLVMFMFAVEHASRLARIFKFPGGNALLVGVGGSGRQSLSRLATYMAEYSCIQIEISKNYGENEWHEDLKKALMKTGGEGKPTTFLFTDTQIKQESFVEDINNILNSGEVPNMFASDEKATIMELVRPAAKAAGLKLETPAALYAYFLTRVKENLHLSLCLSPIGDSFRTRLRQFPALINCCTIDWFSEWPDDALLSVANKFLEDVKFQEDTVRKECMDMCIHFHQSTITTAHRFTSELRRYYYVTPTSYLELIDSFKTLLAKKRGEIKAAQKRYEVGLEKLTTTESSVGIMKQEIIDLQPVLVKTVKETEEMIVKVEAEEVGANKIRIITKGEEAIAQGKADEANSVKAECDGDLAEAMPILNSALSALNTLKKGDITEVKNFKTPSESVKLVMEALCYYLGFKGAKIKDPNDPTKKIMDYWEVAKKDILGNPKLLDELKAYDRENIDPKIIEKVAKMLPNPEFQPERVKKASVAAYGMCCWAIAMVKYDKVAKVVAPKKAKLAAAESEYAEVMEALKGKQATLKDVEDKLAKLAQGLKDCEEKKKALEDKKEDCVQKLDRAEKLINGLGGEKSRWTEESKRLAQLYTNLTGDVLLSSGVIAYLGAFTATFRREVVAEWQEQAVARAIPSSGADVGLTSTLGEPVKIRSWNISGLPTDSFSVENGIIISNSRRWPLMIDPQGQANVWVRNMEAENKLVVMKLTDSDYLRQLEIALQFGTPVLLENVQEELPAALEPVLLRQTFKKGGTIMMKLGEAVIEYSPKFKFYMTTKLRNPHYLPEVSVKVTLLNFMITPVGLEDQMLGIVVAKEKPELEEEKNRLILQGADNKKQLKEIEDQILHVLSSSSGNILDDATAIEVLTRSKIVSDEIAEKQMVADETEARINQARKEYVPVAVRAAILFFCIADLANIEPTYQYSLQWFSNIFLYSIKNSESSRNMKQRISTLKEFFTYTLFLNVCRSLFEKDKLLFSYLLSVKILMGEQPGVITASEFRFFLTGGIAAGDMPPNPSPHWLPDRAWSELSRLSNKANGIDALKDLAPGFAKMEKGWKEMYDSADPQNHELPGGWDSKVTPAQRLCILRALRPDRVVAGVQNFTVVYMTQKFIEPPPFDLLGPFKESNSTTPLIFILSPGSDPMLMIIKFAEENEIPMKALSLGQGQGPIAEKMVESSSADGSWVVLQNCHVYPSWMNKLEYICENFDGEKNHERFRLWLTSYPSADLPVSILQNGVKLTTEPPKGIRANLIGSYLTDPISDPDFFEGALDPATFKNMLYGLCFFHALIQERRFFGPLGWNIPYEFNESDLRISVRQLRMFLNETPAGNATPYKALTYITGECNYGGRVTDPHDRRCLMAYLESVYDEKLHADGFKLSDSGVYVLPPQGSSLADMSDFLKQLPINAKPECFGMHLNADITKDQNETYQLLDSIMTTQPRSGGGGDGNGPEAVVGLLAADMLERLPGDYDIEIIQGKYPVLYEESMNTVLCQELTRFNGLLDCIRDTLRGVQKAIKGLVVMSASLEAVFNDAFDGKIPRVWKKKSYPSLKPLSSYFGNLEGRLDIMRKWVDNGQPVCFNLPTFFFTPSFLTGSLQNFARRRKLPIDSISYSFEFLPTEMADIDAQPDIGVYNYGLYLEGARWDYEKMLLEESNPKELFTQVPVIWFKPYITVEIPKFASYECPLYKTSDRRGILATTGHSTNFVMEIMTPTDKPESHWIKRGVAMLTQLDD
jgi:dynein heavy chain